MCHGIVYWVLYCKKYSKSNVQKQMTTIKTRYCGHLYSLLLGNWTHLDQTVQVFYCKERGLILEPEVSLFCGIVGCPGVGPLLCGLVSEGYSSGVERGLEWHCLLASSVGPIDGWLGCLMLSYWVLLSGLSNSRRLTLAVASLVALICLWSLELSLCDRFEQCWKEVDCLPMVRPDACSHLGIRHVRMYLLGVIDCW